MPVRMTIVAAIIATSFGCANRELTRAEAQLLIGASPPQIVRESAATLRARGLFIYLGNPGFTVMASQTLDTRWSAPARVLGVILAPAFIISWPVIILLPFGGEGKMYWPFMSMRIAESLDVSRTVFVKVVPAADAFCLVQVEASSQDGAAPEQVDFLINALLRRFPVSQSLFTSQPTDNTH